jgi:hypothetical protein
MEDYCNFNPPSIVFERGLGVGKDMVWVMLLSLVFMVIVLVQPAKAVERSTVVNIFINRTDSDYNGDVEKKVDELFQRKTNGIYQVIPQDHFKAAIKELLAGKKGQITNDELFSFFGVDDGVKYVIYLEMAPFVADGYYNVLKMETCSTAIMTLKILDISKHAILFDSAIQSSSREHTATWSLESTIGSAFSVNNQVVAMRALDTALFKAGEAISQYLPL